MTFQELNIIHPILKALIHEGYEIPSPIQEQAIPVLMKGHDLLASAQTGTGKTAAFSIPIIQAIYNGSSETRSIRHIQALVLAPTRELAEQIKDSFRNYSRNLNIKTEVIYGGVSQKGQETALNRGVDVLIATPGRLLDLISQGLVNLEYVKFLVLDEADRMLDMGFIHDMKKIVMFVPKIRQTMLFSATIPYEILHLANEFLTDPIRIEVTPPETMIEKIKQSLYLVSKKDKTSLLIDLLVNPKLQSVLIFTRTKHGANKLTKELLAYGIKVDAIHGNKSQSKRQSTLQQFKTGKLRVLVATDIAARGIDIDELSHVINYDLPETKETYIHRMGRTGRAGLSGEAYTFCSQEENQLLVQIEKHIHMSIPVVTNHPYHVTIRLKTSESDQPQKAIPRRMKKNKQKEASITLKKNIIEKQKKSYHALLEEQDQKKDVFKRSEQPRKKPIIIKEDIDEPKFSDKSFDKKNKGYQKRDFDKDEKKNRPYQAKPGEFKKPYTPKPAYGQAQGSTEQKKSDPQRGDSYQKRSSSPYKKPYGSSK